jgi:uncharacterized tellurite resistance protein B-like protein
VTFGGVLKTLGLKRPGAGAPRGEFFAELRRHLSRLGPERLEYLAGFAGQLVRVAYADTTISDEEQASIVRLLRERMELDAREARLVVDLVRHESETFRGMHHHLLNRAINAYASAADKQALLECLYAVAAADRLVSNEEDLEIRRIASALLIPRRAANDVRAKYRDRLEVLKLVGPGPRTARGGRSSS